jgi:hypothetical protein
MLRFALHKVALVVSVVALTGLGVALSATPAAAVTECNGTLTGAIITGGVVVHADDNCDLEHASVSGGIRMDGGTLTVCDSTVSNGVVVAVVTAWVYDAPWVNIGNHERGDPFFTNPCVGNKISGGVRISGVTGVIPQDEYPFSSVELEGNTISGGLVLTSNRFVEVESNHVSGGCSASGNGGITNVENFLGPNVYSGGNNGCPG